ncbi:OVARIAN TUMOR DOMAIN-containing deubiquitinating enzyme 9-like [Gigantopelta aegis]|uniref:OVARIAN TUMOR DOMAIN-containing deubiquitinating enzyme 9-like n=1 Tax=Gigantopelta aegis TaxID=1735272 RepID=UPI001B88D06E|nr:OVARIAN TUMOR DOMAIN-containing deubiquitinating enzyme 9-like [Gigantopelta aegis]
MNQRLCKLASSRLVTFRILFTQQPRTISPRHKTANSATTRNAIQGRPHLRRYMRSRRADRKGGKSVDPWNGPYIVTKSVGQSLYEVRQTDSSKVLKSKVNGTNMKVYKSRISASSTPPKPQEKTTESTDVQVTRCEENPISFVPTDAPWRKFACQKLDIAQPKGRFPKRSPPGSLEKLPAKIDTIVGDGNCLFRAISKEVSGTEKHHRTIRSQVVQVLGDERYSKHFQGYSGHPDMTAYLLASDMDNNAVWATDIEIVAVASMLNTPVVIHTEDR